MNLHKFQPQVGATSIKANHLDENFARLQPKSNGTYGINESAGGYSLDIFPPFPSTTEQDEYLSYSEGGLRWQNPLPPLPEDVEIAWKLVERCDGKVMYVLGTDWYDPA